MRLIRDALNLFSGSIAVATLIFLCSAPVAWGQQVEKQNLLQQPRPKAVVSASNGIYEIFLEDAGDGTGQYTAATASGFPEVGGGENVLFGGSSGFPGTTFNSIRSYSSNTDYVFGSFPFTPGVIVAGSFGSVTSIPNGFRTTYTLPGGGTTPDALTIVQDLEVLGTTINDSRVSVTMTVTNDGNAPADIGIRYLWDFQISGDDGPTYQNISPNGSVLTTEESFSGPGFQSYKVQDNAFGDSPRFSVFGTVNGPSSITPTPVPPDLVQNAYWPTSVSSSFDYATDPTQSTDGDQATLVYWGPTGSEAITLQPGESYTVSASVLGNVPSGQQDTTPPVCTLVSSDRNSSGQGVATVEFTDNEANSSGLSSISTTTMTNIASVDVNSFVPGAEGPIEATVTQDDPLQAASHTFEVIDVAGNETTCTQTFDALSTCDGVPTLGSDQVDPAARTVSNTMSDNDGIQSFTFSTLDNFTVASITPSGDYTQTGDTWTYNGSSTPPMMVDFTLLAGPTGEATYFLEATDACPNGAESTDFDPIFDLGPVARASGLAGAYPNPFSGTTTIEYSLVEGADVHLVVYDVMGRQVATLADGPRPSGVHSVAWNGTSDGGRQLASGLYLMRLQAGDLAVTRRVTLVR